MAMSLNADVVFSQVWLGFICNNPCQTAATGQDSSQGLSGISTQSSRGYESGVTTIPVYDEKTKMQVSSEISPKAGQSVAGQAGSWAQVLCGDAYPVPLP